MSDNAGVDVAYSATFNGEQDIYYVRVVPRQRELALQSAASIKGDFAIDLPLTGSPGIEDRSGGRQGNYTISFAFNHNLTGVAGATTSCGAVASSAIDGVIRTRWTMSVRAAKLHAQEVTITLTDISDDQSNTLPSASVTVGVLLGDVDADRTVTKTDFDLTKADMPEHRPDELPRGCKGGGVIDRTTRSSVKQQGGTSLP